jgi:hypothetical protein
MLSEALGFVSRLCMERRGEALLARDRGRDVRRVIGYRAWYVLAIYIAFLLHWQVRSIYDYES